MSRHENGWSKTVSCLKLPFLGAVEEVSIQDPAKQRILSENDWLYADGTDYSMHL